MMNYEDDFDYEDDDTQLDDGQEDDEGVGEEEDDDEADDSESEEETEDDEEEAEEDDGTPEGVKRRFATLTKKRREAEARVAELEEEVERYRSRSGQDSPAVYLALAQKHGILPELTDARTAKALAEIGDIEGRVEFLRDTLDDMDDDQTNEITLSGHEYTRSELRKELRKAERRLSDLRDDFGDTGKRLKERTVKLIRLGLAAEKAAKVRNKGEKLNKGEKSKVREKTPPKKTASNTGSKAPVRKRREDPRAGLDRILDSFVN